jgi:ABC-type polar amino acid transport system ATPase subunit
MLRAMGIRKSFGQKKVLENVDLAIERGEIVVLTGPSGGGKTTLLRCLSLLEAPDDGVVELDETQYLFGEGPKETKRIPYPTITIVFQQLFLWPHLTNRDNVLLSMPPSQTAYFEDLVNRFEMKEFIGNYPNQSSLGQKQRVALARAFVLAPRYILLDEATSALDDNRVAIVAEELIKMRQKRTGILLITHSTDLAKEVGDRFFKLERGTVRQIS